MKAPQITDQQSTLVDSVAAARFFGVSETTLARWRYEGKGPRYVKISDSRGGTIRYRIIDLLEFIESRLSD